MSKQLIYLYFILWFSLDIRLNTTYLESFLPKFVRPTNVLVSKSYSTTDFLLKSKIIRIKRSQSSTIICTDPMSTHSTSISSEIISSAHLFGLELEIREIPGLEVNTESKASLIRIKWSLKESSDTILLE